MNVTDLYKLYKQYPCVTTDTRELKTGDIYFALKGDNFNGNNYAVEALQKGASYAIVDEMIACNDERIIYCEDVLQTLQQLAKLHRDSFNIPFIAITGSNGKTTTKELVHAVLSSSFITYTTFGNLNNHIGVPLTILKIKPDAAMAVIEMGANHQKEIAGYCVYAQPTHGLITNCGKAHLEGFGGIEGVKKGKGELFDYLKNTNGTAFINNDDLAVKQMGELIAKHFSYGSLSGDIKGKIISSDPFLKIEAEQVIIQTNLVGNYNLANVLAAVAIGKYFKISDDKIKAAIENYHPSNSRSQLIQKGTNTIILDAYNANPSSMKVAIENFSNIKADKKILMLGSMMELGTESEQEHQELINLIGKYKWDKVILVGEMFNSLKHPYINMTSSGEAAKWFNTAKTENAHILIKGSRSIKMERVLENIPA